MLNKGDRQNFNTLLKAARDVKRVCLVECTEPGGGKRAVICVINPQKDKSIVMLPVAMMLTTAEIEGLTPPVLEPAADKETT
jgi:hypothetical protein